MNLSVTHVITTIGLGGAEKQLLSLVECQKNLGAKVQIIYLKDYPSLLPKLKNVGIEVSSDFSKLSFFRQIIKLRKISKQRNMIFHAHLPRSEILCAFALSKRSFVVTRHNAEPFFPKAPRIISRLLSKFVLHRAFTCIAISQAVANYIEQSREIPKTTTRELIYYGITSSRASEKNAKATRQPLQIGTIARLVSQKNIPMLLKATQLLNFERGLDFHLTITGQGPLREYLRSISSDLGIDRVITWKEDISDVAELYANLNLFVLPSNYEGFGLVLLEAMSYGVPVVARRISAIPEVLGENHPGLIESDSPTELAYKMRELLTNSTAIRKCLKIQSQRLPMFSIDQATKEHNRVYKRLMVENY